MTMRTLLPEQAVKKFWPEAVLVAQRVPRGATRPTYRVAGYRIRSTVLAVPWSKTEAEAWALAVENMDVPECATSKD